MTAEYRYEPGSAHLAVGAAGGVLTPDEALALRLWPLIVRGVPFADVLDEALRDGLNRLPDLVVFELDAQVLRVVVRGKRGVRVRLADGRTVECDGTSVRSWNEQVHERPLEVHAGHGAPGGLPVVTGIVLADGFHWAAGSDAALSVGKQAKHVEHSKAVDEQGPAVDEQSPAVDEQSEAVVEHSPAILQQSPAVDPPPAAPVAADAASETVGLPDTRMAPIDDSFEHLFESTVMRSVEDAAVRNIDDAPQWAVENVRVPDGKALTTAPPIAQIPPPALPEGSTLERARPGDHARAGDHDGSTILAGQLAVLLSSTGDPAVGDPTPAAPAQGSAPTDCAQLTLLLSTGQRVTLDRSVVIGRRPQVDRVSGTQLPHLVTVPSPQQDISRSHVAVRISGTGCVAVDLGSTNGSQIHRVDGDTVALRDSATLDLQPGDVLDLGDGVTALLRAPS